MALRGWRLFGVAGTIFVYIIGILLISLMSIQSPSHRRPRTRIYNEVDPFQTRMIGLVGKHQPLQWCRELKYLNKRPINKTNIHTNQLLQTFPGHYVNKLNINSIRGNRNELEAKSNKNNKIENNDEIKIEYEPISYDNKLRKNFNDFSNRRLTALASFPGSGNTWLRYLLQQSTGIYTGSVYKDYGLLKSGFPGENVFNSSVLVIKTHEWGNKAYTMFSKAILLVRDPEKAILAEFNRQSGGHVGFASPDRYTRTKGRYWQQFVTNKLWAWEQMNVAWAKSFAGDVKIVYYNDLIENLEPRLREIIDFIKYPIDEELFACAIRRREGIYRRKKKTMIFDPYTVEMHRIINSKKEEVYEILGRNKLG